MTRAYLWLIFATVVPLAVCVLVVYATSPWWERTFATVTWIVDSPDGCFRAAGYDVLIISPFNESQTSLGSHYSRRHWQFARAFDLRNGEILGETPVISPGDGSLIVNWLEFPDAVMQHIGAGGYQLASTNRCATPAIRATYRSLKTAES